MPSIQDVQLSRRATPSDSTGGLQPIYIVGIAIAGSVLLGVAVWLSLRHIRSRRAREREEKLGSAFLSVRGIVKDGNSPESGLDEKYSERPVHAGGFSRTQMNAGIPMPERALAPRSREEIVEYHRQSGNFPKPFAFAGAADHDHLAPPSRFGSRSNSPVSAAGGSDARGSWVRYSFMSSVSSIGNRYSVISSATSSFGAEPTTGTSRKVKQFFSPVLPDELLLTKLGEQLTVVQSFDDGWCVVGRENASSFMQKTSLFGNAAQEENNNNVELGVVPAWCFLKPVKGLRAERPVRSTSLGITVQVNADPASRDNLVSWSNF